MASTSASPAVAELVDAFAGAPSDRLDDAFHTLADAVWKDGESTELALPVVAEVVTRFAGLDAERQGHLAVLLGLLAETELPATDGPLATAAAAGVDGFLARWQGTTKGEPLSLALQYLLAHFPADRDRILAAGQQLGLDVGDTSRLDRALDTLDPENPAVGWAFPSPAAWDLDENERKVDRKLVAAMSPEEVRASWDKDTRTVLGNSGAQAHWAVRHGPIPSIAPDTEIPPRYPDPRDADVAIFERHAGVLRCPDCAGSLSFAPETATCTECGKAYPITRGILDLSSAIGNAGFDKDEFLMKLAQMGSMGHFYEGAARPNFTRLCGYTWGEAFSAATEFDYIKRQTSPVDGPVLDIGAGAGTWTQEIVDHFGAERVISLDNLAPMLAALRERLPDTPAVVKDASKLPFGDETLGAVISWNGPQAYIDVAPEVIAEVARCLKPGGTFTTYTFYNSNDPVYLYFVGSHSFPHPAGGLRLFDEDEFKSWFADAGLTITEETRTALATFITAEKGQS